MLTLTPYSTLPVGFWPSVAGIFAFIGLLPLFMILNRGSKSFYFDPKDFDHYEKGGGRELPKAAPDTTFESHLRNYIDVMKLLVTVAAASIAFGATQNPKTGVIIAKMLLAFSVFYGVIFSALLQFFYDEYTQNVRAYTRFRYSLVEALGFSTLLCFIAGYFAWAFNLG